MRDLSTSMLSLAVVLLAAACGTVVGNPKKPGGTTPPTPSAIVYELPEVDFALPEDALTSDDQGLRFTSSSQDDQIGFDTGGGKGPLVYWAKRLDKLTKQVNRAVARVNEITRKVKDETGAVDQGGVLRFSGRGQGNALSGRLAALDPATGFAYEAVICHAGAPFLYLRWTEGAAKLELTQSFAPKLADEDQSLALLSRYVVTRDPAKNVALDVQTFGVFDDGSTTTVDGFGIAERARAQRDAAGVLSVTTVADRFPGEVAPAAFEGDFYLVGKLAPRAGESQRFDAGFVSYSKGAPALCRQGFDETAPDLWAPDFNGPRFCLGRPLGAKRFSSVEEFQQTTTQLQPVGLVPKAELGTVAFPTNLNCAAL